MQIKNGGDQPSLVKVIALLAGAFAAAMVAKRLLRSASVSFADQCVVITGGARGLGLELARLWSAEGARVAICSRTLEEVESAVNELRADGSEIYGEACDVRDQAQVNGFMRRVAENLGPVDVLVNNAGISQVGPRECMNLGDYRRALETHSWCTLYTIDADLASSPPVGRVCGVYLS